MIVKIVTYYYIKSNIMYSKTCLNQYLHITRASVSSMKCCLGQGASLRSYAARQIHRDPYTVLNIKRGASKEEIKAAYLDLSKKYHPDVNTTDPLAKQKFVEINEAYTELCGNGDSTRKTIRTQVYDTWNYTDRTDYRYDYTTYNFASQGFYSNSWNAFLKEKRKSEDLFWKEYFRRNDSKDRYTLNQEEKARVEREFYEWHSRFYGDYQRHAFRQEQTVYRPNRSFIFRILIFYTFFQVFLIICIGLSRRWDTHRMMKSNDYKEFKQKLKEEEIIYGPYHNHKERRRKQKQRHMLEDELKEYSYYQQSFNKKGK